MSYYIDLSVHIEIPSGTFEQANKFAEDTMDKICSMVGELNPDAAVAVNFGAIEESE